MTEVYRCDGPCQGPVSWEEAYVTVAGLFCADCEAQRRADDPNRAEVSGGTVTVWMDGVPVRFPGRVDPDAAEGSVMVAGTSAEPLCAASDTCAERAVLVMPDPEIGGVAVCMACARAKARPR